MSSSDISTQILDLSASLRKAALKAAARGWYVFPAKQDKRPFIFDPHGQATTDPAQIEKWWKEWPLANPAVSTGRSGLLVDDCDMKLIDGQTGYSRQQDFLDTRSLFSFTPSGGCQFYFKAHPDIPTRRQLGNIDLQAGESYVLLPPSRIIYTPEDLIRKEITDKVAGTPYSYSWGNPNGAILDAPPELLALVASAAPKNHKHLDRPELLPNPPQVDSSRWKDYQRAYWERGELHPVEYPSESEAVNGMATLLYIQGLDDAQVLSALYSNRWVSTAAMKPIHNASGSEERALNWLWLSCEKTRDCRPKTTEVFKPLSARDLEKAPIVEWPQALTPRAIEYRPENLSPIVDSVDQFLYTATDQPLLYTRAGGFCRVARIPSGTVHGVMHQTEHLGIVKATQAHIKDVLTRYIQWQVFDARKKGLKPIACPPDVVQLLYDRGSSNTIQRPLVGVIEAPTLREDGSILSAPGYDESTGLYLRGLPVAISESPSLKDAQQALSTLNQPFVNFPFPTPNDRAVALSAVLTGLVRPILKSAPMFLFDAPKMGSGKTLLTRVIGYIVLGSAPANTSWTKDSEETEKRLFSTLMSGTQIVVFDNVSIAMQSETLCTILTEGLFRNRVLGESREAEFATNCLWMATGNSIRVRGDLSTRVLRCTIDAQMEYPEFRTFTVNLDEWVPAHRQELVAAALTILRGYVVAGRPLAGKLKPETFGRFEQWSSTVREALVWAGGHDPLGTLGSIYADDDERHELADILYPWLKALGEHWYSVTEIGKTLKQKALEGNGAATGLLETFSERFPGRQPNSFDSRALGTWLRDRAQRIEENMRIERLSGRPNKWRVKHLHLFG